MGSKVSYYEDFSVLNPNFSEQTMEQIYPGPLRQGRWIRFALVAALIAILSAGCGGGAGDWRNGGDNGDNGNGNGNDDDDDDDDDDGDGGETAGSIEVSTTTEGDDLATEDYDVSVDGELSGSVSVNGTTTLTNVDTGQRDVFLSEVPNNCRVQEGNPKPVTVSSGETATVDFTVQCEGSDNVGDLLVTTDTTGDDIGSDDYLIVLNQGEQPSQAIGLSTSVQIQSLAAGTHQVALTDLPSNCTVDNNPRNLEVRAGREAETTFEVQCGTDTGNLEITTETEGSDFDDNRYIVEIVGNNPREIGADDSIELSNLAARDYIVTLTAVNNNCTVDGNNPRTVTVDSGETTEETFTVQCVDSSETGDLQISTTTAGNDATEIEYGIEINGGAQRREIGPEATITLEGMVARNHTVLLTGVPGDCALNSTNPVTVPVLEDNDAEIAFAITCTAATGALVVTTATDANLSSDLDSNGYTLLWDEGSERINIDVNARESLSDRALGDHSLTLTNVANNCALPNRNNPVEVEIRADATASAEFAVDCFGAQEVGDVVVTVNTRGAERDRDSNGYQIEVGGGTLVAAVDAEDSDDVRLEGLAPVLQTIELTDVADNCLESRGEQSQTVQANPGSVTPVLFTMRCDSITTTLDVAVVTAGQDEFQDSDGYVIRLNGGADTRSVQNNDVARFSDLAVAEFSVELTDVAPNCRIVNDDNPFTVTTVDRSVRVTSFAVNCDAP